MSLMVVATAEAVSGPPNLSRSSGSLNYKIFGGFLTSFPLDLHHYVST